MCSPCFRRRRGGAYRYGTSMTDEEFETMAYAATPSSALANSSTYFVPKKLQLPERETGPDGMPQSIPLHLDMRKRMKNDSLFLDEYQFASTPLPRENQGAVRGDLTTTPSRTETQIRTMSYPDETVLSSQQVPLTSRGGSPRRESGKGQKSTRDSSSFESQSWTTSFQDDSVLSNQQVPLTSRGGSPRRESGKGQKSMRDSNSFESQSWTMSFPDDSVLSNQQVPSIPRGASPRRESGKGQKSTRDSSSFESQSWTTSFQDDSVFPDKQVSSTPRVVSPRRESGRSEKLTQLADKSRSMGLERKSSTDKNMPPTQYYPAPPQNVPPTHYYPVPPRRAPPSELYSTMTSESSLGACSELSSSDDDFGFPIRGHTPAAESKSLPLYANESMNRRRYDSSLSEISHSEDMIFRRANDTASSPTQITSTPKGSPRSRNLPSISTPFGVTTVEDSVFLKDDTPEIFATPVRKRRVFITTPPFDSYPTFTITTAGSDLSSLGTTPSSMATRATTSSADTGKRGYDTLLMPTSDEFRPQGRGPTSDCPHVRYSYLAPKSASLGDDSLEPVDHLIPSPFVKGLTFNNFQSFLSDKDRALVMFYESDQGQLPPQMDWVANEFTVAAATTNRRNHAYAAVNCTAEPVLCAKQRSLPKNKNVTQLPFFNLFSKGNLVSVIKDYTKYDADTMRSHVESDSAVVSE